MRCARFLLRGWPFALITLLATIPWVGARARLGSEIRLDGLREQAHASALAHELASVLARRSLAAERERRSEVARRQAAIEEVRVHLRWGEWAEALERAFPLSFRDPGSVEAIALAVEARFESSGRRDRASALAELDRALALDPRCATALALRAWVRLERHRMGRVVSPGSELARAEADARAALEVDPRAWRAKLVLAEVAEARSPDGPFKTAADALAQAAAGASGHHPDALVVRGRLRSGGCSAEYLFQDAVWRTAGRPGLEVIRVIALVGLARYRSHPERCDLLIEAIRLSPTCAEAYLLLGACRYEHMRRPEGAEADLLRALELDPTLGEAHYHLALRAIARERYDEALERLDRAEAVEEEPPRARDRVSGQGRVRQGSSASGPVPGRGIRVGTESPRGRAPRSRAL